MTMGFPRPGRALIGVMVAITCIWVMFAVGLNFGDVSNAVLAPFVGDVDKVLHGQVWRLLTAPLIHDPRNPWHLLTTLMGLYFLGTPLEQRWGAKRTLLFLVGSAAFAYAVQVAATVLVPRVGQAGFYGGLGMVEAVAIAWALAYRNATVRLFFVLPVSGTMLLVFVVAMSVLNLISLRAPPEGLITPFGGMLAGWLFGELSPLRRLLVRLRFRQLQGKSDTLRRMRTSSPRSRSGPPLRVLPGGQKSNPKDKRWLN
ncbi:uncharacterized protein CMC5_039660 [Chondromyces crocatus]|uniref:Peptidase S54 rhomboid domain-containing protein n=2 Tax=Chondromyces crocatus TaxID=52 RepID=A0A0K1EG15_CHOCO|nr:uncharacterized protein CMC5_039660 [Chondromyces crocatus]